MFAWLTVEKGMGKKSGSLEEIGGVRKKLIKKRRNTKPLKNK